MPSSPPSGYTYNVGRQPGEPQWVPASSGGGGAGGSQQGQPQQVANVVWISRQDLPTHGFYRVFYTTGQHADMLERPQEQPQQVTAQSQQQLAAQKEKTEEKPPEKETKFSVVSERAYQPSPLKPKEFDLSSFVGKNITKSEGAANTSFSVPLVTLPNYPTTGESMMPFIKNNQILNYSKVPASEVKTGDVVLWSMTDKQRKAREGTSDEETMKQIAINMQRGVGTEGITTTHETAATGGVVHQVIWKNETHFVTQGTNNLFPDRLSSFAENYKGKAILDKETEKGLKDFFTEKRENKSNLEETYGKNASRMPFRTTPAEASEKIKGLKTEEPAKIVASAKPELRAPPEIVATPADFEPLAFEKGGEFSQAAIGTSAGYGYYATKTPELAGKLTDVQTNERNLAELQRRWSGFPTKSLSEETDIFKIAEGLKTQYNFLETEAASLQGTTDVAAVERYSARASEYEKSAARYETLREEYNKEQAAKFNAALDEAGYISTPMAVASTNIGTDREPQEGFLLAYAPPPRPNLLFTPASETGATLKPNANVASFGGAMAGQGISTDVGGYVQFEETKQYQIEPMFVSPYPIAGQPTNDFEERYQYHTQNIKDMIKNNIPFAGDINTALNLAQKSLDEMAKEQAENAVPYTSNPAAINKILSGIAGIPKETIEYGSAIPAFMAASQDINARRNQIGLMRLKGGETLPDIVKTQDDYGYGEFVSKNAGGAIVLGGFTAVTMLQPELKSLSTTLPQKSLTRSFGLATEKAVDAGIKTAIGLQFAAEPKETVQTLGPFMLVAATPNIAGKIIEPARFTELDLSFKTNSLEKLKVAQEPRQVTSVFEAQMQPTERKFSINQGDLILSRLKAITNVKSTQMLELPISNFIAKEFGLPTEMKVPFTEPNQYRFKAAGKLRMFIGKDELITPASITSAKVASSKSIVAKGVGEADLSFYPSQKIQYTNLETSAAEKTSKLFMKREGGGRYAQDIQSYTSASDYLPLRKDRVPIPKKIPAPGSASNAFQSQDYYTRSIDFSAPSKVRVYAKYPKIGSSKTGIAISRPFGEAQSKPTVEPSTEYLSPLSELPSIGEAPKPATLTAMDYVSNIPTPSNKGGVIEITQNIPEIQYGKEPYYKFSKGGRAELNTYPIDTGEIPKINWEYRRFPKGERAIITNIPSQMTNFNPALSDIQKIKFREARLESDKRVDLSGDLVRYKSVSITKSGARLSEYETKFTDLTAETTESGGLIRYEATTRPEWEIINGKRFRIKTSGIGTIKTLEPVSTTAPIGTEVEITPVNFEGGLSQVIHTPPTARRGMKPWVELKPKVAPKETVVTSSGNQMMKQMRGESPTKVGKSMQDTINAYATSHAQAITSSVKAQAMEIEYANVYPPNAEIQTPYMISMPRTRETEKQRTYPSHQPAIAYKQRNQIIILQKGATLQRGGYTQKIIEPQRFGLLEKGSVLERFNTLGKNSILERGALIEKGAVFERGGILERVGIIDLQRQPPIQRITELQRVNPPPNFGINVPPPPPPPPWLTGGYRDFKFGDFEKRKTYPRKRKEKPPKYTPSIISIVSNYRAKVPKGVRSSKISLTGLEIRPIPI